MAGRTGNRPTRAATRRRPAFDALEGRALLSLTLGSAQSFGSGGDDLDARIVPDPTGQYYYLAGSTDVSGINLDPAGSASGAITGQTHGLLAKYTTGGTLVWAEDVGSLTSPGNGSVSIKGIAVDPAGDVYLAGSFNVWDGSLILGTDSYSTSNHADAFVAKYDPDGTLLWDQRLDAAGGNVQGMGVAYSGAGDVYVTGMFTGSLSFGSGSVLTPAGVTSHGGRDIFAWKVDAGSGAGLWARGMGGTTTYDEGHAVTADAAGNVYLTGQFYGTADFDPGPGTYNLGATGGGQDAYIAKLDPDGRFVWAGALGGSGADWGSAIAVDGTNNVLVAGCSNYGTTGGSADFDPGPNKVSVKTSGSGDIFVAKYDANRKYLWAASMGGPNYDAATALAVDASGNVYTTGFFGATGDFDPGKGTVKLTASTVGGSGSFVSKLGPGGQYLDAGVIQTVGTYDNVTPHATGDAIAVGGGSVYIVGEYQGIIDADPGPGSSKLTSRPRSGDPYYGGGQPSYDIFVARWN